MPELRSGRAEIRRRNVNAECRRRIFAVVDDAAQLNLAGASGGGKLTDGQLAVYRDGLDWIQNMRSVAEAMKLPGDPRDPTDDRHWPTPSEAIIQLANAF